MGSAPGEYQVEAWTISVLRGQIAHQNGEEATYNARHAMEVVHAASVVQRDLVVQVGLKNEATSYTEAGKVNDRLT
jgi:hypothetical protein